MIKKAFSSFLLVIIFFICFASCSGQGEEISSPRTGTSFNNIEFKEIPLKYSEKFEISVSDGYSLLTINESDRYLVIDEGVKEPSDIPMDMTVIKKNLKNIYNASSPTMDFFLSLGQLDKVTMTGTDKGSWTVSEIVEAIENEDMVFVGKYSAPDYEYLADSGCDLAIENTMITHSPKTKELIESLSIPVLVEYSSYENHPLGRMEWIKVYGLLTDNFEKACEIYDNEVAFAEEIRNLEVAEKKVAFFYISSNGYAVARKPGDYITRMIDMAGGKYAFDEALGDTEGGQVNVRMELETFFLKGYDSDIIIYNSTIDGGLNSIDELIEKSDVLKSFDAVKNGRVYVTKQNFFQKTMSTARMIGDFNQIIVNPDVDDSQLSYLYRIR